MASRGTLKRYRDWVETAKPGDEIAYHEGLYTRRPRGVFEHFREESDQGRVMLYQRMNPQPMAGSARVPEWCALRISPRAARFVKEIAR